MNEQSEQADITNQRITQLIIQSNKGWFLPDIFKVEDPVLMWSPLVNIARIALELSFWIAPNITPFSAKVQRKNIKSQIEKIRANEINNYWIVMKERTLQRRNWKCWKERKLANELYLHENKIRISINNLRKQYVLGTKKLKVLYRFVTLRKGVFASNSNEIGSITLGKRGAIEFRKSGS